MSAKHLSIIPFLVLAAAGTAHADAVADFKTGTTVFLSTASVSLSGGEVSSSGGVAIRKQAGTLDFELQASDLGVPVPLAIHLRGSPIGGGRILYTVDESYSPPIDLGDGHWASRLTGRLIVIVVPLRGTVRQEHGNVKLSLADASSLDAQGDWGTLTIAIKKLGLIGGVSQPPLDAFADTGGLVCSDRVTSQHAFTVSLPDVAQANGAWIELVGARGIRLPSGVVVHAGSRSTTVIAHIDPGFVGTARLTAAAGGVARSLDVVVHAPTDCAPRR